MKSLFAFFFAIFVFLAVTASATGQAPANTAPSPEPVFRAPFSLKLQIDKKHFYERQFDKVPYVADNNVYLFVRDNFGINVTITGDRISGVTYQPAPARSDVVFTFTQEKTPNGPMMLLVTKNNLKRKLVFDALMTIPGQEGIHKTSILPIQASLSSFESWPDPIVQLVLQNFRFPAGGPNVNSGAAPSPAQK